MKNWIEQTLPAQIEDLKALVRIPSVSRGDPAEPGKPFGKTVYEALQAALAIARRLGLKAWDTDGYCGVVEYGEGEEILGILAHLDVVPEGEGWSVPPYSATEKDGRIIGRGTLDDKSPALSAIYALAAAKECGLKMKRRVRVILGCDEEIGSLGVEHYLKVEGQPTLAFTPDAEYPVVNSEMGIMHTTYEKHYPSQLRIDCGTAANVIPGVIRAELPVKAVPVHAPAGYTVTYDENRITVEGRGGHASMPEFAKNALQALMKILTVQPLPDADKETVRALYALWQFDMHGESLGIDVTDESGRITYQPDVIRFNENGVRFIADCRHPFTAKAEDLLKTWDAAYGKAGFARTDTVIKPGHFIPADSELVSTLMNIYNELNHSDSKPLSMGGGTYARELENAVAFGIVREGEESMCHMPDESISIEDIRFNTNIMAEAIRRLAAY
ncbi:MAG: Sapep family Mn(2+)-dependent dipeptidase [Clostridia bacterium]|nr:Sapep family Mn(2+)-dependent dipeptidase [Clostridia bacterium]MBR0437133.1 Sapep family Mn(2+)-dependent dipeptidase [Clostridia bacterium]